MTAPDAMPERMFIVMGEGGGLFLTHKKATVGAVPYVPEQRALDAERERDKEFARAERANEERREHAKLLTTLRGEIGRITEIEVGLRAECDLLRAERDALVPLAWWGLQEALGFVPEITPPTDEQIAQARAILALYAEASRGMAPEESTQYKAFLRSRFTPAERQGEEGQVTRVLLEGRAGPDEVTITLPCADNYAVGDRVRVTRIEEGAPDA